MNQRPPCPICEKTTEGEIEIMISIRYPITGVVHRGIMHVRCAQLALHEVAATHHEKPTRDDATPAPETKPS